jgi:hypothetical protein
MGSVIRCGKHPHQRVVLYAHGALPCQADQS